MAELWDVQSGERGDDSSESVESELPKRLIFGGCSWNSFEAKVMLRPERYDMLNHRPFYGEQDLQLDACLITVEAYSEMIMLSIWYLLYVLRFGVRGMQGKNLGKRRALPHPGPSQMRGILWSRRKQIYLLLRLQAGQDSVSCGL